MVFFTCNSCGASLKKNQVEKHYQNECRNCNVLSCMDCGKDFYGDEYARHTKCITEAEKYQGALYKEGGGGGSTKGEKKQAEWLERVKQSASTSKVTGKVAKLLERIAEYPNIPRKRKKFENFVRNSINVRDSVTLSELWDAFSGASDDLKSDKTPTIESNQNGVEANGVSCQANGLSGLNTLDEESVPVKKAKKKKQDELNDVSKVIVSEDTSKKTKKTSKHTPEISSGEDTEIGSKTKTKKKKEHKQNGETLPETECVCGDTETVSLTKKKEKKKNKENPSDPNEKTGDESTDLQLKKKKRKRSNYAEEDNDNSLREPTKKVKMTANV